MKTKRTLFCIVLSFLFALTGCATFGESSNASATRDTAATDNTSAFNDGEKTADPVEGNEQLAEPRRIDEVEGSEDARVVDETEHYKVMRCDSLYYYWIYDEDHVVVRADGPLSYQPDIAVTDDGLVMIPFYAGPQKSTQGGCFYDVSRDVFSRTYTYILDRYEGRIAYGAWNGEHEPMVVVRDIFDKTGYYQEISTFEEAFSPGAEPITGAEFVDDGTRVAITYRCGPDYKEVVEVFDLVLL